MTLSRYLRYFKYVTPNPNKRVVSLKVNFVVSDTVGDVKVTDMMVQAGKSVTGYTINTEEMLKRTEDTNGVDKPPRYYNGIVRGSSIIIVPNEGTASSGLDVAIRPVKTTTGDINFSTYYRTRHMTIKDVLSIGDVLQLNADEHTIEKNGTKLDSSLYGGAPLISPSGRGMYRVELHDRDTVTTLFTVTEVDKSGRNY